MLSKKSFLADEQNFSAPLVGPMLANVRDHIESQQNDHRASYISYRGLRRPRQLKPDLCEIFGAPQFSTFSTASVKLGSRGTQLGSPLCPVNGHRQPGLSGPFRANTGNTGRERCGVGRSSEAILAFNPAERGTRCMDASVRDVR